MSAIFSNNSAMNTELPTESDTAVSLSTSVFPYLGIFNLHLKRITMTSTSTTGNMESSSTSNDAFLPSGFAKSASNNTLLASNTNSNLIMMTSTSTTVTGNMESSSTSIDAFPPTGFAESASNNTPLASNSSNPITITSTSTTGNMESSSISNNAFPPSGVVESASNNTNTPLTSNNSNPGMFH